MINSNETTRKLSENAKRTLLLEIELNGKIALESLLNAIYNKFGITYRILNAEIEFYSGKNFGKVQLLIDTELNQHQDLEFYFNHSRVLNTFIDYPHRRAV